MSSEESTLAHGNLFQLQSSEETESTLVRGNKSKPRRREANIQPSYPPQNTLHEPEEENSTSSECSVYGRKVTFGTLVCSLLSGLRLWEWIIIRFLCRLNPVKYKVAPTLLVNDNGREDLHFRLYESISDWLVHLRVQNHGELCSSIIVAQPPKYSLNNQTKTTGADNPTDEDSLVTRSTLSNSRNSSHNQQMCSICHEELFVGDIVSWSPNPACDHVFHHSCFMDWMQFSAKCPLCKQPYIPPDGFGACREPEDGLFCFVCIDHGIIQPSAMCSKQCQGLMEDEAVDFHNPLLQEQDPRRRSSSRKDRAKAKKEARKERMAKGPEAIKTIKIQVNTPIQQNASSSGTRFCGKNTYTRSKRSKPVVSGEFGHLY